MPEYDQETKLKIEGTWLVMYKSLFCVCGRGGGGGTFTFVCG